MNNGDLFVGIFAIIGITSYFTGSFKEISIFVFVGLVGSYGYARIINKISEGEK